MDISEPGKKLCRPCQSRRLADATIRLVPSVQQEVRRTKVHSHENVTGILGNIQESHHVPATSTVSTTTKCLDLSIHLVSDTADIEELTLHHFDCKGLPRSTLPDAKHLCVGSRPQQSLFKRISLITTKASWQCESHESRCRLHSRRRGSSRCRRITRVLAGSRQDQSSRRGYRSCRFMGGPVDMCGRWRWYPQRESSTFHKAKAHC
jgi:hypothetical protein